MERLLWRLALQPLVGAEGQLCGHPIKNERLLLRAIKRATRARRYAARNKGVHTGPRGRNKCVQGKKVPPDYLLVGGLVN